MGLAMMMISSLLLLLAAAAPQTCHRARRPSHNVCLGAQAALSIVHLSATTTRNAPRMPPANKLVAMGKDSVSTQMKWHHQEHPLSLPAAKQKKHRGCSLSEGVATRKAHGQCRFCLSGSADDAVGHSNFLRSVADLTAVGAWRAGYCHRCRCQLSSGVAHGLIGNSCSTKK